MRVRHRVPSVFSLSMVDVFCCALGSIILLWLIGQYQAKAEQKAAAAKLKASQNVADADIDPRGHGEEQEDRKSTV